jgi:hypothetical protein
MLYGNRKDYVMRIITGAILIVGAIWLFTSALPYGNSYGNMPGMIKHAFILAGLTAILGMFYLFVGSVEAKENARWYQFTIKSILALTIMVALFFSGRAMGLRESMPSPYLPPVPSSYSSPYSSSSSLVVPPTGTYMMPVRVDSDATVTAPVEPVTPGPSSDQPMSQPVTNPPSSTPPNQPASQTP